MNQSARALKSIILLERHVALRRRNSRWMLLIQGKEVDHDERADRILKRYMATHNTPWAECAADDEVLDDLLGEILAACPLVIFRYLGDHWEIRMLTDGKLRHIKQPTFEATLWHAAGIAEGVLAYG